MESRKLKKIIIVYRGITYVYKGPRINKPMKIIIIEESYLIELLSKLISEDDIVRIEVHDYDQQ